MQATPQSISSPAHSGRHHCDDLIAIFHSCFGDAYNTRLVGGWGEPLYRPASPGRVHHEIRFREDFFASALHEVAHWCIAGSRRRRLEDYGYWYAPDGRNDDQQAEFERVEVKPQALEWWFATVSAYPFRVSVDNTDRGVGASDAFYRALVAQARRYLAHGLPARAARFARGLAAFYRVDWPSHAECFQLEALR